MPNADWVRRLAQRVAAMPDPATRVGVIKADLRELDAKTVVEVLAVVLERAEAADPEARNVVLAISLALADPSLAVLRNAIVEHAASVGRTDVVRFARAPSVRESSMPPPDRAPDGRPLTLGERKSLARRVDRGVLLRALCDPHPDVVRIALRNPGMTEDTVVRFCARRPGNEAALRAVFEDTRWIVRYRVKVALVRNPGTPIDVALALAPHLQEPDARDVAESPDLPSELRHVCSRDRPPGPH